MLALLLGLGRLGRAIARSARDPEFRALLVVFLALMVIGTVFYSRVEGWSVLDAVYFCTVTMATVGYGDHTPKTTLGKAFTIVYILVGTGVFVSLAARLAIVALRRPDGESSPPSS